MHTPSPHPEPETHAHMSRRTKTGPARPHGRLYTQPADAQPAFQTDPSSTWAAWYGLGRLCGRNCAARAHACRSLQRKVAAEDHSCTQQSQGTRPACRTKRDRATGIYCDKHICAVTGANGMFAMGLPVSRRWFDSVWLSSRSAAMWEAALMPAQVLLQVCIAAQTTCMNQVHTVCAIH
jgi:hypothetical protein